MDVKDAVVSAVIQGYEAEFVKPLEDKYKCPVCKKALRNPVQTPCAHRLCESCAQPILRSDNPRCPLDNEELALDEVFRDVCCRREVMELKVYCNNKSKGCSWSGELNGLEAHLGECLLEDVQCPNAPCEKKLPRNLLNVHLAQECKYKPLTCEFCQMHLDPTNVESHKNDCPEYPVLCEAGCPKVIPRSQMTAHFANDCTEVQMRCSYHKEGCLYMGFKDDLDNHEMSNCVKHLTMIREKQAELFEKENDLLVKIENMSGEKKELAIFVKALEDRMVVREREDDAQREKLTILENLLKEQHVELSVCHTKIETISSSGLGAFGGVDVTIVQETQKKMMEMESRVSKLEKEVEDALRLNSLSSIGMRDHQFHSLGSSSSMSIDKRLERSEHQLTLHDIQLAEHDLKIQMLDTTSYDGSFVWKIDDFTRRRHEAMTGKTTSIYSPPFYLGRFGYKVCARVYLNGDGSGRGTHLSLFFVIMRGEYDALLNWPFQQLVTFKLLHQGGNRSLDIIDSFRPDSRSASFRRPTTNMNIASGCPEFASHDLISSGNFIMDDTIYLKIIVDMRELNPR